MKTDKNRRRFMPAYKKDAVALVTEQGCVIPKLAQTVDTGENNRRRWQRDLGQG